MMKTNIENRAAVPWWAAILAPLVGVPILVALLALVAPGLDGDPSVEATTPVEETAVDVRAVEHPVDAELSIEVPPMNRS